MQPVGTLPLAPAPPATPILQRPRHIGSAQRLPTLNHPSTSLHASRRRCRQQTGGRVATSTASPWGDVRLWRLPLLPPVHVLPVARVLALCLRQMQAMQAILMLSTCRSCSQHWQGACSRCAWQGCSVAGPARLPATQGPCPACSRLLKPQALCRHAIAGALYRHEGTLLLGCCSCGGGVLGPGLCWQGPLVAVGEVHINATQWEVQVGLRDTAHT